MTTPDPVRAQADRRPLHPALVTPTASWTWTDLDARVGACARRLARLDAPNGRVGVVARTQPDLVVLVLGALRARRTLVPLSPRWTPAMRREAADRLGLQAVVDEGAASLGALARPDGERRGETPPLRLDAPFTVVHTSGSTGPPKAALHTWGNHVASARGLAERFPLGPGDRWLLDLPLAHVGGLGVVVRCALAGATLVLPGPDLSVAEAVTRLRPTYASLVSTQLVRLLRDVDGPLDALRVVLLGGSAFPPALLDEALGRGLPVVLGYGMTEMTSTVTSTALPPDREALDTSGTALTGREVRVSDSGEIEVRGASLFAGYVEGGAVRRPVDGEGWYATGDRGALDASGRLVVEGRIGNGFVSGGENVQPEAIEAALLALPEVDAAVVVAVPDAEFGARPVAFVRTHGVPLDAPVLEGALRRVLPGLMVPDAFYAWEGPVGLKPDRTALAGEARRRAE